jgi:hypothetical protein
VKNCHSSFCVLSASVVTLLVIFWTVYALLTYLVFGFAHLDPKLGSALAATAGTIVASIGLVVVSRWLETVAAAKKELRDKLAAVYEQLLQHLFRVMTSQRTGEVSPETETLRFMGNFAQRMMVWGSDDVLAAWSRLRTALAASDVASHPERVSLAYEELVRTIRRDLGHDNRDLESGKLLALFLDNAPTPAATKAPAPSGRG